MIKSVVRILGLKGSWKWACRQMDKGFIVHRTTDTGSAKYRLDPENQRRIVWAFTVDPSASHNWKTANIFLDDFETVCWAIW